MRLVRRDRRAMLLRHRWKHGGSALFIGAIMVVGACYAGMSDDVASSLDMSTAGGLTIKQTPAMGSRRLGYPQDRLIGRWTEDGTETFAQETIFDPRYQEENRTKKVYVGEYKYAPPGRKACIIVHIIGVMYMLIGLNTVCDLYFCGALEEMVERWDIPPDVAGATLMAAGGSAPELFTSIIGAIITESDVGFSTIVGSAVFNVLAVIGCCGMAAQKPIKLTWWPLFRDCTFYIISLLLLAVFASGPTYHGKMKGPDGQICDPEDPDKKCGGGKIKLHEAIVLFIMYLIYCTIAYFNEKLQAFAQTWVEKFFKESTTQVQPFEDDKDVVPSQTDDTDTRPQKTAERRALSMSVAVRLAVPNNHDNDTNRTSTIREDGDCGHKIRHTAIDVDGVNGRHFRRAAHHAHIAMGIAAMKQGIRPSMASEMSERSGRSTVPSIPAGLRLSVERARLGAEQRGLSKEKAPQQSHPEPEPIKEDEKTEEAEDGSEGSDDIKALIYPPDNLKDQVQWALCLPVCAPMYLLIPRPEKCFLATFFISLVFIAFYSYWLVYCVQMFSDSILGGGNSVDVTMGFTLLAAGTSIPDLVSSMVVARAGEGDMAVSSSIGSNIFDILVGLPIPWIIKIGIIEMGIHGRSDYGVSINSPYIFLYVILLLFMVTCVICSILIQKWYLNRTLGIMMGVLYFVFLLIVIPLELFQYI